MNTLKIGCKEAYQIVFTDTLDKKHPFITEQIFFDFLTDFPLQKIFYGPPGTGKSTKVNKLIEDYGFEVVRTTFHPDIDYQSFVGGYKPVVVKNEENGKEEITYRYAPQTFTNVYVNACQNPGKRYLLIIEEINRGNCAQIFGDLFQCLDRNDAGYSEYEIDAEADLAKHLELKGLKSEIKLPPNLFIYATMNTSDQSLFPMDSAFKRRWDWEYVPIDYDKAKEFTIIVSEQHRYNWGVFIAKVNKQIVDVTGSEDKQLGTFFVKSVAGVISLEVFKSKVLFYLWSEVFKNQLKTGDTIFHYNKEDGTSEEFTFADLFEQGRDMDILPSFMQKLGVDLLDHVAAV
ncbi:McrB family protein [Runella sp.]|uniref:McrB family protein n=1 Tax=Runella sp. TaxID=1960881 RepID=UPI0026046228|nr:AAA family ATPase [Runella sp.]